MAEQNLSFEINLAELDEIVIDAKASHTDSDLTNILYFGEVPINPDVQNDEFKNLFSAIEDWKAWETTKCEQSVEQKIAQKLLPSDLCVASRAKRAAYRAKVLDYLRSRSSWIVNAGGDRGEKIAVPMPAEQPLNLAVVDTLIDIEPWAANLPYRNLLKAVGAAFSLNPDVVQPYYHTLIGFQYDDVIEKFQTVLLTVSFTIDLEEQGVSDDIKASSGVVIEFTSTPATFSEVQWNKAKPDPATTEPGRKLNLQRSFTVVAPTNEE